MFKSSRDPKKIKACTVVGRGEGKPAYSSDLGSELRLGREREKSKSAKTVDVGSAKF